MVAEIIESPRVALGKVDMQVPALSIKGLSKHFGGLVAVDDVSFDVHPGTIVGIIGPNGSGKSTLFNLITHLIPASGGEVTYYGSPLKGKRLHQIARMGIGRTYQAIRLFPALSVWINIEIAAMGRGKRGWEPKARTWLSRLKIDHLIDATAAELSVGQQRLLEIAMNIVVEPDLLLLDEPLAGVNPIIRDTIYNTIASLREQGKTFLIIEHHIGFIMKLCDKVLVLENGKKIADGKPQEVQDNSDVINALLGHRRKG